MSTLSDTNHPLSPPYSVDSDPLLYPSHYREFPNPNAADKYSSYIDPPSYADAIFNPFDTTNGVDSPTGSSGSLSESPSSNSEYIRITVSNAFEEIVPGSNSYIAYLITTRTNVPEFGGSELSVRRRFREVVALADRLAESYRGFFLPARPEKSVVESQMMQMLEFVEQRRVALEKYLRRLAAHPVIRKSEEFLVFLNVQVKLPLPATADMASRVLDGAAKLPKQLLWGEIVIAPHEVVQPAKGWRDLMGLFNVFVANDWGGSKPEEEDMELSEMKEKIQELEQQINHASQQAESLIKAQQDMGETIGELGLAFIKLTKFENEEAVLNTQRVRAADMKGLAMAAVNASRFYRELNTQTVKHLVPLNEYLGLKLAVHRAFSDRSSALLTVQTLGSELSSMQSRAKKLEAASSKIFGGDKSRIHKLEELEETIRVTEDAIRVAVREYEWIKEINRSELERLDRERQADFLNMLKGFVVSQVGYTEKIADVWTKVVEETSGYVNDNA